MCAAEFIPRIQSENQQDWLKNGKLATSLTFFLYYYLQSQVSFTRICSLIQMGIWNSWECVELEGLAWRKQLLVFYWN